MPDMPLAQLQLSEYSPKIPFNERFLDGMARRIELNGTFEPIIVRTGTNGHYEVISGEDRYLAAQRIGREDAPVVIQECTDIQATLSVLIDNVRRDDLSAVDKARLCVRMSDLLKSPGMNEVAVLVGVQPVTVRAWLRTLDLPEEVQERITPGGEQRRVPEGFINYQNALRVAEKIKNPQAQVDLVMELTKRRLPHKTIDRMIQREADRLNGLMDPPAERPDPQLVEEVKKPPEVPQLVVKRNTLMALATGTQKQVIRRELDSGIVPGGLVEVVSRPLTREVVDVVVRRLGELTDEDVQRAGAPALASFQKGWKKAHGSWNPEELVYLIGLRPPAP